MKKIISAAAVAATVLAMTACNQEKKDANKPVELNTLEQKVSYIVGYDVARNTDSFEFKVDPDIVSTAINDMYAGVDSKIPQEEVQTIMQEFSKLQQERRQSIRTKQLEENKVKGDEFLASNLTKEGIKKTESGLQYKVITAGTGASPKPTDKVKVHYKGTLLDGTEFDSSHKRGQPATFGVTQVIPGWVEALQLMKEGGSWEIYVPGDLAYGAGGTPNIPPNSTLIFTIDLLEIVKPEPAEKDSEKAAEKK